MEMVNRWSIDGQNGKNCGCYMACGGNILLAARGVPREREILPRDTPVRPPLQHASKRRPDNTRESLEIERAFRRCLLTL